MGSQVFSWIDEKIKKASEEANFTDWKNYTEIRKIWEMKFNAN